MMDRLRGLFGSSARQAAPMGMGAEAEMFAPMPIPQPIPPSRPGSARVPMTGGEAGDGSPASPNRWSLIGATMQDVAAGLRGDQGGRLDAVQATYRANQAKMARRKAIEGAVDPTTGRFDQRRYLKNLMEAGQDPSEKVLDGAAADVEFINGLGVDKRDAAKNVDRMLPQLEKGQEFLFDAKGGVVAVRNVDGTVRAAAEMAGAVTGAQEAAKAGLDIVELPTDDGSSVSMTRRQAAGALTGDGAALPPGIGRTQSPADKTYDEQASRARVERDFTRPKAQAALTAMEAKTGVVDAAIERAMGKVSGLSAGLGAMTAGIPSSPARDLRADLETIKANLGFDELQTMRDNSPTGGALGQVAVQELEALRATLSSLDQAQSPEALVDSLRRVQEIRRAAAARRREAFANTYGDEEQSGAGREPPPAPAAGQRRAGGTYNTPRGPMKWTGTGWLPAN